MKPGKRTLIPVSAAALLLAAGCSRLDHSATDVVAIATRATQPNQNGGASSERGLDTVQSVPVPGFPELPPFEVASRERSISKFPCAECHNKPLAVLRIAPKDKKASHWDIRLAHGKKDALQCNTCHNFEDFANLKTLTGKPVAFNHSYQVCGQCHSRQINDWAGGAHGKRVGGWAPPRVVTNCTGCHSPHKPHIDSRWPSVSTPGTHDSKGGTE